MAETLALSISIGIFVGISAGYLGSLMVLKKMALVGDALSHVALPGLALGLLFGFDPFLGAFAFLFASALLIWYVGRITKLSFETVVGAIFTLALALGIIIIPQAELLEALFGDITQVTMLDTVIAIAISLISIFLTKTIYKKLVIGMISEDLAISKGVNVAWTNLLYLLLVSLVVAVGIRIVGTLLVGFLVVVPAAAAKNLSSDLLKYSILSAAFGAASSCAGILMSSLLSKPPGPMVVFAGIAVFALSILMRWKAK